MVHLVASPLTFQFRDSIKKAGDGARGGKGGEPGNKRKQFPAALYLQSSAVVCGFAHARDVKLGTLVALWNAV